VLRRLLGVASVRCSMARSCLFFRSGIASSVCWSKPVVRISVRAGPCTWRGVGAMRGTGGGRCTWRARGAWGEILRGRVSDSCVSKRDLWLSSSGSDWQIASTPELT